MRFFFRCHIPEFNRVLLVESGSRYLVEDLLPGIYEHHSPVLEHLDIVTCYAGLPKGFDESRGRVFRVGDFPGRANRAKLYALLSGRNYSICGIVCAGEPIMTKWKWVIASRVPAKLFLLNENGDYFWFDRSQWRTIRHFMLFRAGLAGAGAVRTLARLAAFPFTLAYLLLFTAMAHLRRRRPAAQT
ncbi:MAG: hypothetical protein U0Q16_09890 [Bryobacteraceae bacterium]